MIRTKSLMLALAAVSALAATSALADDSALLNVLVKKGVLSQKEADKIQAEVDKQGPAPESQNLGSKIKLGSWVKELDLSGDFRLRNQWDQSSPQIPQAPGQTNYDRHVQRDRWRFRLRLNADIILENGFFAGVQLSTGDNRASDTQNTTYTGGYDNYNIYISKAFIGWKPTDGLTFVVGKQDNPFYTTDLFWDPDIYPTGLVERVDFHKLFGWGAAGEPAGYSKDGKTPPPAPAEKGVTPLELSLIAGQFIFYDNSENSFNTSLKYDAYQFETQLKAKFNFSKNVSLTVAPAAFITNDQSIGGATAGANGRLVPGTNTPAAALGTLNNATPFPVTQRDELFVLAPGDFTVKVGSFPISLYWDFAYNFQGGDRFSQVYGPLYSNVVLTRAANGTITQTFPNASRWGASDSDRLAWAAGLKLGQNKKQGDFAISADYRQVGIAGVDPNINDSDINLSFTNFQGVVSRVAYNLTDFLTIGVNAFITWNLTGHLYGGYATGNGFPIANANSAQVVQVDLNMKF